MKIVKLKNIRIQRSPSVNEFIIDFNNDRHHSVAIDHNSPPEQIASDLHSLAEAILRDPELKT